jgi:NAD(P)H dehydrogenase (quinone)
LSVLLVFGHPVPESFSAAIRDAAVAALEASGHDVDLLDLYAEGFDPVLSIAAHALHLARPGSKPEISQHVQRLRRAEALVFVYPTWLGGPPAIIKGWIDRVWVAGVAFELPSNKRRIVPLLQNIRRLYVITTYGSSRFVNMIEGEPGKRMIMRGLRTLVNPRCRTRWVACYGMDRATQSQREAFLVRVDSELRW